jgi:hypothetical protein
MTSLPLAFLAALGVSGRVPRTGPEEGDFGPIVCRALSAYAAPVAAAMEVPPVHAPDFDPAELDAAVRLWAEGYRSGELKTVRPPDFEGGVGDNVVGDIEAAKRLLCDRLSRLALAAEARGATEEAGLRWAQALAVQGVNKGASLDTLRHWSRAQIRAAERLSRLVPRLGSRASRQAGWYVKVASAEGTEVVPIVLDTRHKHLAAVAVQADGDAGALSASYERLTAALRGGRDLELSDVRDAPEGFGLVEASARSAVTAQREAREGLRAVLAAIEGRQSETTSRPSALRSIFQPVSF